MDREIVFPDGSMASQERKIFFIGMADHDLHVTCRPVYIPSDISIIAKWLQHTPALAGFTIHQAEHTVRQTYEQIAASDSTHCFMLLLDEAPACVTEITDASQDELCAYYSFNKGDYIIRLLFNDSIPHLFTALLNIVVRYCLSFSEVSRLIIETDSEESSNRAAQAGLVYLQKVTTRWNELHLYYIQREM